MSDQLSCRRRYFRTNVSDAEYNDVHCVLGTVIGPYNFMNCSVAGIGRRLGVYTKLLNALLSTLSLGNKVLN
jgi:hypothetical protein